MVDDLDDVARTHIAALERDGEFVDAGSFTLDAAAARHRIREHRVASTADWLLFAAEAGVALARHVHVTPRLGATVVEIHGVSLSSEELAELGASRFAEAGRAAGLAFLALSIELALEHGARLVQIDTSEDSGAGSRCVFRRGRDPVARSRSDPLGRATTLTVVHASRLGWSRRQSEYALLEQHCRPSGAVGIGVDEPSYRGGIEGLLAKDFFSWSCRRGDASELTLGYEPGFDASLALLFCNGVRLETVELGGPRGVVLVIERPWARDLSLRRARRDATFEGWLRWARAWAEAEVASIRPRRR